MQSTYISPPGQPGGDGPTASQLVLEALAMKRRQRRDLPDDPWTDEAVVEFLVAWECSGGDIRSAAELLGVPAESVRDRYGLYSEHLDFITPCRG